MPDSMPPPKLSLTLIVAATSPALGIGSKGSLPWRLKSEMWYFARVTTRLLAHHATTPPTHDAREAQNAVIMGRKTWESIPAKFRPLKGRVNVVLSRSGSVEGAEIVVDSLEAAVEKLQEEGKAQGIGRAFVIGGATVYEKALGLENTKAILMTKVHKDYECDTFWPVDLDGEEGVRQGWKRKSKKELETFIGEEVEERMQEGDVEFEYCLYERE